MNYRDALESTRNRPNRSCDDDDVLGAGRDRKGDDSVLGAGADRKPNGPADMLGPTKLCPQKKGTVLRIFIPPGAEINLLDIIEIASPGGICVIVRLPFLENLCGKNSVAGIFDSIKRAGGRVEFVE
jgi:hypothetical protein